MIRKNKLLICSLFMCLALAVLPGMKSSAEENQGETSSAASEIQDENSQRLEETTGMDENANIYQVDDEDGSVENGKNGIALFSRSSSGTMVVNFNTGGNKVTYYTDEATGAQGYTNGAYGADAACLGMSGDRVRFMLAGVTGTVARDDVEVVNFSTYKDAVSYYTVSDGKLIHYISQNLKTAKYSQLNNGTAPSCLSEGVRYYSYDGHYFYTDYDAMILDYQNGTRENSVNKSAPFYNYYQFLSLRSRTGYGADVLDSVLSGKTSSSSKLRNTGTAFVTYQNNYGVNALLALSIAANESGWGTSNISQQKNNLFGLNAVDSSPGESADTFSSVDECIRQFMANHMSSAYLYPKYWSYNGGFLGNKGGGINVRYASDPYWGEKAAAITWTLDGLGGGKDEGAYTIGVVEGGTAVNVRSGASTGTAVLYTTGSLPVYPMIVLETEADGGFYKIQSEGVINSDRSALVKTAEYDFEKEYAYISADYASIVNTGNNAVQEPSDNTGDGSGESPSGSTGDGTVQSPSGSTGDGTIQSPSGSTGDGTIQSPSGNTGDGSGESPSGSTGDGASPSGNTGDGIGATPSGGNTTGLKVPAAGNNISDAVQINSAGKESGTVESGVKPETQTGNGLEGNDEDTEASLQKQSESTAKESESNGVSTTAEKAWKTVSEKAPQTGDFTDFSLWLVLAGVSLLMSAAVIIQRKYSGK